MNYGSLFFTRLLRAFCALSARSACKCAVRAAGGLAVLAMCSTVPLSAQTPDLEGEYGSNKSDTAQDPARPKPGDAGEPWSHYLNPWAHPGVADYLGMPTGGGTRTYGETIVDGYPLKPLGGTARPAEYDSNWSTKTWIVNGFTYKRRRVTLKSGASLVIFAPTQPPDPDACLGAGGVYDRDALFIPVGYQGGGFELRKGPPAWSSDSMYTDPYGPSDVPFGYEIEQANYVFGTPDVVWLREGSVEWEALERGMTLVYVHLSLGQRPLATHLAQLIETSKWMDSCRYAKTCYAFPPSARISYRHRNFIFGGSYHGAVARIAAIHLPWVFRGAISVAGAVDMHATFAWQQAYEFLQNQLLGVYPGGFLDVYDLIDADVLSLFGSLSRGYAGPGAQSITGVPVDVAGAGLFAWDLPTPLRTNTELIVPLVLAHGDDDQSQYSFFGEDLETWLILGSETFGGTDCSSNARNYTGVVVERRAPNDCHTGLIPWNATEHAAGRGLLDLLMDEVDLRPLQPIPFASSNPTGDVEWSLGAAGADDPHVARVFRDELLRPKIGELPPAAYGDFSCNSVTDVPLTGDWQDLRDVCEGLGMPDSIVGPTWAGTTPWSSSPARPGATW